MNNLTHVTWLELQETLLSFDPKLERFSNLQPGSKALNPQSSTPPSANFANKQNPSNNNNNNGGRGYNPNMYNYSSGHGRKGYHPNSHRGNNSRGRGRGGGRNSRPTSQVRGKYGHSRAYCYNRHDESFMRSPPNNGGGQEKKYQQLMQLH
uniref:Uncharacterized protein n=1 Tax=Cannabis sativa TaxID=3483 RepID=A0A803QAY0_CANSA